ncbi:MAG: hypothetical protein PHP42_10520, partial [Bacteroidota bacterium]|nr:hypothetical protein [Bacteroidota bacterium]
DSDNNDYTVQINLGNFFANLPQNPKQSWLPTYTVDTTAHGSILWRWQAQDYASFTFPDPTFGGLFPGMTNETLKRIMHIDEAFAWKFSVSMNDDNGLLNSGSSLKLLINGTTYLPKPMSYNYFSPSWKDFYFLVPNNNNQTVQIIAIINGADVPLQFSGLVPVVRLKSNDYGSVNVTQAPQNITAQYVQTHIEINLQRYSYYKMERAVNTGTFAPVDSFYNSSYTDYNVAGKTTYKYRASLGQGSYWGGYYATRQNNYTNTVSITTP